MGKHGVEPHVLERLSLFRYPEEYRTAGATGETVCDFSQMAVYPDVANQSPNSFPTSIEMAIGKSTHRSVTDD